MLYETVKVGIYAFRQTAWFFFFWGLASDVKVKREGIWQGVYLVEIDRERD